MSLWQKKKQIYTVSMYHDMVVPHMHHGMKCNHGLELRGGMKQSSLRPGVNQPAWYQPRNREKNATVQHAA